MPSLANGVGARWNGAAEGPEDSRQRGVYILGVPLGLRWGLSGLPLNGADANNPLEANMSSSDPPAAAGYSCPFPWANVCEAAAFSLVIRHPMWSWWRKFMRWFAASAVLM